MSDTVSEAAARLERAVGRLAEVAARPRPQDGIAPARVAELAGRLDGTLARLRAAMAELDGADEESEDGLPAGPGVTAPDGPAAPPPPATPPAEGGAVVEEDGLPAAPRPADTSDQEH